MKNFFYFMVIVLLVSVCFGSSCCSVYTSSTFSTDSANVHNLKIVKTDSVNFSPIKK